MSNAKTLHLQFADGEIEVGTLIDALYERDRTIAILRQHKADYMEAAEGTRKALEAKNAALAGANDNLKITISELVDECDQLKAELAAIKGQQPVAFYWQDIGYPEPRTHGPYFGQPSESALRNVDGRAIPVPLYTLPPASPDVEGLVKALQRLLSWSDRQVCMH